MTDYIVLTKVQGDAVRGQTSPMTALNPVETTDGDFILPVAVLSDPAHGARRGSITGLPRKTRAEVDAVLKREDVPARDVSKPRGSN